MNMVFLLISTLISATSVTITWPAEGETYSGDWLMLKAIVENENEIPDSVHYELNGQAPMMVSRLNTDWYTYMANDSRTGYSEASAPHTSEILWARAISGNFHEFVSPVIVDGRVYYSSEMYETTYCLDAATGDDIWRFEDIGDPIDDAVHVEDGRVYLASDSIWCLDALTGDRIWAYAEDEPGGFKGPPVPHEGRIFASGLYIHALEASTGERIWRTTDLLETASSMTAWNDMLFVPEIMSSEACLYALNTDDGEIVWSYETYYGFWDSSPCLVDSVIYIGSAGDEKMYAFDALSGSVIWELPIGTIESTPACDGCRVIFGAYSTVYSVDPLNGDTEWEFTIPDGHILHGSPGIADGLVFWGDFNYFSSDSIAVIHAVDLSSGQEVWNHQTIGGTQGIQSSPAITDGVMYIAATDSMLYAFGTGLKYTYREEYFYADVGANELIVTSFDDGSAAAADTINFTVTQTGLTVDPQNRLQLSVSPNPFTSSTAISFHLPEPRMTRIEIYDLSGRLVHTLSNAEMAEGEHVLSWDGTADNGNAVSTGLYMCRVQAGGVTETTGLCLLR
ncbi:MAG: PQQ-binding-like beta-propeller repeat protein [Candidatus Aegiribacteria sp.]|nr:PQQ-binding-like beta-propeller repeat protein [Candidatus Aegiribacteria sp.]MBD3295253.1 PQQ-binding-like beta-propeller repeat protein [Candidatus Fermentibacteria bacterium]